MTGVPPQPTLTDGDLTLRPWRDEDLDIAHGLADDQMVRWFGLAGTPPRSELADAVERSRRAYAEERSVVNFVVELAGETGPVGTVEVRRISPGVGAVTWTTYKPYRGRQIARRAVRVLVVYAFGELGLDRLQVHVDPDNRAAARVAIRSGFRREGLLRGGAVLQGERRDVAVYGLRRDDPRADTLSGWTALMDSVLPKKRVIAHVVVRDPAGRVLLCKVSYKKDLELPGGVVEPDEDPLTGARREMEEELGTALPVHGVLAIDWLPRWEGWGDAIEILYDGGVHDASLLSTLRPDGFEILGLDWYAPEDLAGLVSPLNARRLPVLLADPSVLHNLRDGSPY
ncbi:NUDIX hydrolase [Kribbella italica]|uniref:RimJ/RimL family protein N-acetyltransferase/8-oxo-dGTP pyrophosphatase MutT (NUDIX family) n=1 Tax=Kribbella italica TaxID=1540520 RepID=A0A7W9J8A6_9ACTN|nr:RimJ/RimL family protein N-acetyltransferase/8-oxo-dGTP pyrophosphatase MutT (NUDIX family) [Kribbella italica]